MKRLGEWAYRVLLAGIGGLPLLALSAALLSVWINPQSIDNGGWVRVAASLVLFEFLLLHSGAFMSAGSIVCSRPWQRLAWFLGFGLVYGASMISFANWSGGDYVFWTLFAVLLSRLFTLVILRDRKGTILMLQRSALGMIILVTTALICFIPLPSLGITEEARYAAFGAAEDALTAHPERTMAWGALYFLLMGLAELFAGWRLPDWADAEVNQAWKFLQK